jgi:6-phosphogluconolactonase
MKPLRVFSDSESMAQEISRCWHEKATQHAKEKRVFSVVLSGGSAAPTLYSKLAKPEWRNRIPWNLVHIFFADERCVPPDHEESNYKMICDQLLSHIPIRGENIHRIRGEEDPEKEAIRYACEIQNHFSLKNNSEFCFDWVLMGLGVDGHSASLFPGQEALLNPQGFCGVAQHPETNQKRITMTVPGFQCAKQITYHVVGFEKSKVVSELISESSKSKKYPASQINGEWYLDEAAASCLNFF